jgi:hypothetical protein
MPMASERNGRRFTPAAAARPSPRTGSASRSVLPRAGLPAGPAPAWFESRNVRCGGPHQRATCACNHAPSCPAAASGAVCLFRNACEYCHVS